MLTADQRTCQCEHVAHFRHSTGTPAGKPGHFYNEVFHEADLVVIPSPLGGHIRVCAQCAGDCHGRHEFKQAAVVTPQHFSGVCDSCSERSGYLAETRPGWLVCPHCADLDRKAGA